MPELIPNAFLIGVQKSATTSLYDWIGQHPDVCAPFSMKDTPFFIDDTLYAKGTSFLDEVYRREFGGQRIILNGSANIIYFEHAVKRMAQCNPQAKLLLVLRNPVERAISAYNFAVKRNMEDLPLMEAVNREPERIAQGDLRTLSNNTYVDHGKYYEQISRLYNYYPESQVLIFLYEDIRSNPSEVIAKTYAFLGLDTSFEPNLRSLNKTGSVRFAWIRNALYSQSGIKKFLVKNVLDKILPYDRKYRLKIFFLNLVTSKTKERPQSGPDLTEARALIRKQLQPDIEKLQGLLGRDLNHWNS